MASRRVEDPPVSARRRQALPPSALPAAAPAPSTRDILLRSWPGRLFVVATGLKLVLTLVRLFGELPAFLSVLNTLATLALLVALSYFVARLFVLVKRRLLWRVRRKLILSYIFIGVVPALLIMGFFLFGAIVLSMNLSAYLFRDGYDEVIEDAGAVAEAAVSEISRARGQIEAAVIRIQQNGARALGVPTLSLAFLPASADAAAPARAGEWEHAAPPEAVPGWLQAGARSFTGSLAVPHPDRPGRHELVARAVRPATVGSRLVGHIVADIPIDDAMVDSLHEQTGIKIGAIQIGSDSESGDAVSALAGGGDDASDQTALFSRSVVFFDVTDWESGGPRRAAVSMSYRLREMYGRIAEAQAAKFGDTVPVTVASILLWGLMLIAGLFLVIEIAALVMGLALARSITSSIHELFMGTERVRQGDFTHRIRIETRDQLGELADSFNQMTGSIENLLQTAAEKKRLEEELRIARQIQMSLLPRGPLDMAGLSVTALCVPAREVGGDYYDFFRLGDERLGVLIADVSGKGTSAALYMAELKGLVLSLSQIYHSPREMLLEVNRIISENLDTRSFITMTYAVLDLAAGVMTFARAGHTPLIYLPAPDPAPRDAQVLTPSGLVVGLRIDGAAAKFAELLEEEQIVLMPGDVIVLYTDGITEAMNAASDLFGDRRLSRLVEEHGHLASGELRERILREIEAFVGGADQHDDMTMILIKIEGTAEARVAV